MVPLETMEVLGCQDVCARAIAALDKDQQAAVAKLSPEEVAAALRAAAKKKATEGA